MKGGGGKGGGGAASGKGMGGGGMGGRRGGAAGGPTYANQDLDDQQMFDQRWGNVAGQRAYLTDKGNSQIPRFSPDTRHQVYASIRSDANRTLAPRGDTGQDDEVM